MSMVEEIVRALVEYLQEAREEKLALTELHKAELAQMLSECVTSTAGSTVPTAGSIAPNQPEKPKGLMRYPFGYCPICGEPGIKRARANKHRPYYDTCAFGHRYLSTNALVRPKENQDDANDKQNGS